MNKLLWNPNPSKNDMTYILGAKCVDGVALVGDTKITIDGGADFTYAKKIISQGTIIMGASGLSGLFADFQNRIVTKLRKTLDDYRAIFKTILPSEFPVMITKTIREMCDDYKENPYLITNNLQVILANRFPDIRAELTVFSGYGYPEPVKDKRAIGHGEPYGALFLKKLWNKTMTMEQTAKLGIFIIKFIQEMELDSSVGFNDEFLPQVFTIPDIKIPDDPNLRLMDSDRQREAYSKIIDQYPVREFKDAEVRHLIEEIEPKISDFKTYLKNIFRG